MQVSEFKAWFEGFTESIEGLPNKKQWERVKEKVALVDGKSIVYREYVDRWYSRPYYGSSWTTLSYNAADTNCNGVGSSQIMYSNSGVKTIAGVENYSMNEKNYDSHTAMYSLGKSEALEVEGSK